MSTIKPESEEMMSRAAHPAQTVMQRLLPISLSPQCHYHEDFFCDASNREAYNAVVGSCEQWFHGRLMLMGPTKAGKTHLCHIWQKLYPSTRYIDCKSSVDVNDLLDEIINSNNENPHYVLDNLDAIYDEIKVLSLLNILAEIKAKVLITITTLPQYTIPDLRSRVNATTIITIKVPEASLTAALLQKHCSDRQLRANLQVLSYLQHQLRNATYQTIYDVITIIDELSVQKNRMVTISMAKEALLSLPHYHPEYGDPFHNL